MSSILATTTTSETTTITDMKVLTPKEMEKLCQQPLAILTAGSVVLTSALHILGMFTLFIQMEKMFNPAHLATKMRHTRSLK